MYTVANFYVIIKLVIVRLFISTRADFIESEFFLNQKNMHQDKS